MKTIVSLGELPFAQDQQGCYTTTRPAEPQHVIDLALLLLKERVLTTEIFSSPDALRPFLQCYFSGMEREVFVVVHLTNQHQVITVEPIAYGTIDGASVYPREVVKAALACNAAAVIFAHNHPSGAAEPSSADKRLTQRLKDALALVDVRTLDHFVVGTSSIKSFAEEGLL